MNLEPVMKVKLEREKQISYINTYIWNLEKQCWWTYFRTRIEAETIKTDLWTQKGRSGDELKQQHRHTYTVGVARAQSCPAICNLMARLLCPCNFPTKNTGMGCHFLHQGIFPIQGSNSCPVSSALAGGFFTTGTTRETHVYTMCHVLSHFSHVQLCATPWTVVHQAPQSMGFSRQEHWSGSPCPPPEGLSNPGMEPTSLMSRAIADRFFATSATWEVLNYIHNHA